MDQDDVNEEFQKVAFMAVVTETEEIINRVIELESLSRHEIACNNDPHAASIHAAQAHHLLGEVKLAHLATLVLAMADKYNQDHEAYLKMIDEMVDVQEHLRQFRIFQARQNPGLADASMVAVESIIAMSLNDALYQAVE